MMDESWCKSLEYLTTFDESMVDDGTASLISWVSSWSHCCIYVSSLVQAKLEGLKQALSGRLMITPIFFLSAYDLGISYFYGGSASRKLLFSCELGTANARPRCSKRMAVPFVMTRASCMALDGCLS